MNHCKRYARFPISLAANMYSFKVPICLAALLTLCLIASVNSVTTANHTSDSMKYLEEGEIYAVCNNVKDSNDAKFESNLNGLLENLTVEATYTGFSTSSYGYGSHKLFGRFQCRGDLPLGYCRACAFQVVEAVGRNCPDAIGAHVQLEYCFLRYEKYDFVSRLDTSLWYNLVSTKSSGDPHFILALTDLMSDLSTKAPESDKRFALGWRGVPNSNVTIYGMQSCWRDMSTDDCEVCVTKGIEEIYGCCKENVGAQVFMGSCTLRYEIYPFANQY